MGARFTLTEKPYTPDTLAERWGCSAQTVRNIISQGDLPAFRVGRLFRIKPEAVEEYECQQKSASEDFAAGSVSHGVRMESDDAISFRHAVERKRKPKR